MIESLKTRTIIVVVALIVAVLYVLPNFVTLPKEWPFKKERLNYGLDIQGGAHLIYGVDVPGVMAEKTARSVRSLEGEFKSKKIAVDSVKLSDDKKSIIVTLADPAAKAAAQKYLEDFHGTTLQITDSTDKTLTLRFFDKVNQDYQQQIIGQAIGVIRNRVDEFGVSEPLIAAQGDNRILVQLPGVKDPARAKDLINRTARLSFNIVSEKVSPDKLQAMIDETEKAGNYKLTKESSAAGGTNNQLSYSQYIKKLNEDVKAKLPPNTILAFEKAPNAVDITAGKIPYLLESDTDLGGEQLEDASVMPGEYGQPEVIFRFDPEGRRRFSEITGRSVNRRMAIVLDSIVQSAPVIQGKIDSDTARITLHQNDADQAQKEANFIATALRAGALPAALEQLEERTVGPTLGSDSIEKGKRAGLVGLVIVLVFVVCYYKAFGIIAGLSLVFNLLCMLAILDALNATITLPGIAGIVLTLGMAIDANVIIFERIKEELARGINLRVSIRDGFGHAFTAIFDANITNAIAAGTLIYFGSGPVRGFGVTLIVGILTSMFTAIFVTRVMLDLVTQTFKVQKLPI
jgi:preprotein translocase subunit SecD